MRKLGHCGGLLLTVKRSHTGKRLCPCFLRACAPVFSPCSEVRTSIGLAHMCGPVCMWPLMVVVERRQHAHTAPSPPWLSSVTLWGGLPSPLCPSSPCSIFHLSTWHHRAWSRFIYWPVSCQSELSAFAHCCIIHSEHRVGTKEALKNFNTWMDGDSVPEVQTEEIQSIPVLPLDAALMWYLLGWLLNVRIIFGRWH